MSKCWEVRLDGLPWFPGEQGCLLLTVNWEERASAEAAYSASLSWAFFLLTSLPFSSLVLSFSACFWNHLFGHGSVHLDIWCQGQPGKKKNTPILTLSGSLFNSCSLQKNTITTGILPHTHFVNCHECLWVEWCFPLMNCFDGSRPLFTPVNHAFWIKCPL